MRVLVVGNDTYNQIPLQGCHADASAWGNLFNRFPSKPEVKILLDAKRNDIMLGIGWLTSDADTGVFVYSGHGTRLESDNEPDGFSEAICPIDMWEDGGKFITDRMLSEALVGKQDRTICIFDCCHIGDEWRAGDIEVGLTRRNILSGRFIDSAGMNFRAPDETRGVARQRKLWYDTNVAILAACKSTQVAYEVKWPKASNRARGAFSVSMQNSYSKDSNIATWCGKSNVFLRNNFGNLQTPRAIGNPKVLKQTLV